MDNKLDLISEAVGVLRNEAEAILNHAHLLQQEPYSTCFKTALQWMKEALELKNKIIVCGVGKSGKVGQKIAATLCSMGSFSIFLHPTEGQHGDLGVVQPGDIILALSHTGNTEEVLRLIPVLKSRGARIIGVGGNADSQLARDADLWIQASVKQEACPHNLAPTTSTTLALAIGDAIAVTLMQMRGFDSHIFAQNHPGGSLGRRLYLKVEDLMHRENQVAVVSLDAGMDEVIVQGTQKKLGAVLVVQGSKLEGIITDGDIRRALHHRERFFQLKAKDLMTSDPITASPSMLAWKALELMENRTSQISVLPVLSENQEWVGLLRLHDLIKMF